MDREDSKKLRELVQKYGLGDILSELVNLCDAAISVCASTDSWVKTLTAKREAIAQAAIHLHNN